MKPTPILDGISRPEDVAQLSHDECRLLADELRDVIVERVSKNGGHLASSLGVVDLTIALLSKFAPPHDQIVWDVGHQAYAYKLLTGRKDRFDTLRQYGGVAGFPKQSESVYDVFGVGHSSTSVSAALGLLRAKKLQGDDGHVIAVIGDGAMTGGMAFEGLNDTGHFKENLTVILNDNQMSIDKNVGGLSRALANLRSTQGYIKAKSKVERFLLAIPLIGRPIARFIMILKTWFRLLIRRNTPPVIFEDLGFQYFGPFDGHNIALLKKKLEISKTINGPVLIHIVTQKGKGYPFAEENPSIYHGVSPFDREKGVQPSTAPTFTSTFSDSIVRVGKANEKVVAICAAMMTSTGLKAFRQNMKLRFFDVGIAEEHAVTMAAGMATNGFVPVVALYSTFAQRAYDQMLHDVCLQNLHVVLALDRAGIVGADGMTHQGIYDISMMLSMPNVTLLSPCNFAELDRMLEWAVEEGTGLVAVRYPRGGQSEVLESIPAEAGIGPRIIRDGSPDASGSEHHGSVAIVSLGVMCEQAIQAAEKLAEKGISCRVIDARCCKPLDITAWRRVLDGVSSIVTIEDGVAHAGFGSYLLSELRKAGDFPCVAHAEILGVSDQPLVAGKREQLLELEGMDAASVAAAVEKVSDFLV
ncbi:MAG: 1-deoxy-D-xylulose-5-phosphate synthase [Clostridiales bacterium]|nr:1-deoxy-D-xylulose-5-phosphate synthase [Clostridiales bacterium]